MATINYTDDELAKWTNKFNDLANDFAQVKNLTPHFGTANDKTHAINEGTRPLITCDKCAAAGIGCASKKNIVFKMH